MFSVLMTILWSSVLITLFSFLRTRRRLLHVCSISTVILIYLFCAVRLAFPFEVPWVRVVGGGSVYNRIHSVLNCKVGSLRICEILFAIWMLGAVCSLAGYWRQYRRAVRYFQSLPREESRIGQELLNELDGSGRIKVLESTGIKAPCCIGIFRQRIFLPAGDYDRRELQYILLHEYTHLAGQDILLKALIRVLCCIYWWNPPVYWLKRDLDQSLEIRCDLSVAGRMQERERADYLDVMLKAFNEGGGSDQAPGAAGLAEAHSGSLLERFRIVADMGVVQKRRVNVLTCAAMLLTLAVSYSFILQSKYDTPLSEIETGENIYYMDLETSYILKQGEVYTFCTEKVEKVISEETALRLQEVGYVIREVSK